MVSQLFAGLGGGNMARQLVLYQILGHLVGGATAPYFRDLTHKVNQLHPNDALTPTEAAALVERTYLDPGAGAAEAALSGVNAARFRQLVQLQEQAPPPEWLAVAARRGIISSEPGDADGVGFWQGIAQGTIATKWGPAIREMATSIPTPELALDALLEGQRDEVEAKRLYEVFGGDPEYFELAYDTRGGAPTPVQAGILAKRGIIPWDGDGAGVVSYRQAFLEGPWRNKWLEPMKALADYLPPPRTVTAMVREGSLTDAQATELYQDYGLTPELAAAYLMSAHRTKTEDAHTLARTTIEALYRDRVLSRAETLAMLTADGYSERDADYLLQVVDLAEQQRTINAVVTRIRTLYASYKLDRAQAVDSMHALGYEGQRLDDLFELWDLQRAAQQHDLTAAELTGAFFYGVISQEEAQARLVRLGYTPHDAWIALSVRKHAKLDGEPPRDSVGLAPGMTG